MHQAVELILARMKSNPEDFNYDPYSQQASKWNNIISYYSQYFSAEENKAINEGYEFVKEQNRLYKLDQCMESIYEAMAGDDSLDTEEEKYKLKMKNRYHQTILNSDKMSNLLTPGMTKIFNGELK